MERLTVFQVGPRFFTDGNTTMFEFRIDSGNVIGPRKATPEDMKKHAKVWDAFIAQKAGDPPAEEEPAANVLEIPRRRGRPPKVQ